MSRQTLNAGSFPQEAFAETHLAALAQIAAKAVVKNPRRRFTDRLADNSLSPLEARRLMAADAGSVAIDDGVLDLAAADNGDYGLAVELDADGSHLRGVIVGTDGTRTAGDWVDVDSVRQIRVAGSSGTDHVRIDGRLAGSVDVVQVSPDVEAVEVYHVDTRSSKSGAARLARQIGGSHAGLDVSIERGRVGDSSIEVQDRTLPSIQQVRVETAEGVSITLANGSVLSADHLAEQVGLVTDVLLDGGFTGSVHYKLVGPDGTWEHTENYEPYAVFGDEVGVLNAWSHAPGEYRLETTAFTGKNGTGRSAPVDALTFTVSSDVTSTETTPPAEPPTVTPPVVTPPTAPVVPPTPPVVPPPAPVVPPASNPTSPDVRNDVDGPTVALSLISDTIQAGLSVHGDGFGTTFKSGQYNDATFEWDFGDAGSAHNSYRGFVAGHVYDTPGTYTVTLTVTDDQGRVGTATRDVRVVASTRTLIHVDVHGNDSNDGSSPSSAVRTAERANELLASYGDDVEILFRRGQSHKFYSEINVQNANIVISAYGTGSKPDLEWHGPHDWTRSVIVISRSAEQVTVRGLSFDNANVHHTGKQIANAIRGGGQEIAVLDNSFYDVSNAILNNAQPTGMLVQGNTAPSDTGIRAYFVWGEGEQLSVVGNTVGNSTREHIVRVANGIKGVTVAGNDFDNIDRTDVDRYDTPKGTVVMQHGSFAYVSDNTIRGASGVGPLGDADGLKSPSDRFEFAVFEFNDYVDDSFFHVEHGAEHIDFRYNRMSAVDGTTSVRVEGYSSAYDRTVVDLTVHGNVATNFGTQGRFIWSDWGVEGIELTDNVLVAPNFNVGNYQTFALYHGSGNLNEYTLIDGNTWPEPTEGGWAQGGMMYVGTTGDRSEYRDADEWNNLHGVGTDTFADVNADTAWLALLAEHGLTDWAN